MNEIKVYTVQEAADILKVTERTLYSYIKGGKLGAKKIGKYWRIPESALKAFIFTGIDNGEGEPPISAQR